VGAIVAALASVVYALCGAWLPQAVAVLFALAAGLLLTGAMHELGFAAFCDGYGRQAPGARTAALLRESPAGGAAVGTLGVLALLLLVLLKFETLSSIDASWIALSLIGAAAFSRGCLVWVMAALAPVDSHGQAFPAGADRAVAYALAVLPSLAAAAWTGNQSVFLTAMLLGFVAAQAVRHLVRRQGAGASLAGLGAVQQVAELAYWIGVLATLTVVDEAATDTPS
jgi:adenosylcobinamide-GDP ribazoletransferase